MKMTLQNLSWTPFALAAISVAVIATGCTAMKSDGMRTAMHDGEVLTPAAYRGWTKFVPTVDKPDAGQVREIYINQVGLTAKRGMAFPPDTVSVMEIYAASKDAAGNLRKTADGRLIKDELKKVFVMAKAEGAGARQPAGTVNNGDWLYGAYLADGKTPATTDFAGCRGCHAPLATADYVARYDEHFDQRM